MSKSQPSPQPQVPSKDQQAPSKGIPLKIVFLHQAITWPGIAGSEKSLSAIKMPGVKMHWTAQAVVLELKGERLLIPHANVVNALVALEAVEG